MRKRPSKKKAEPGSRRKEAELLSGRFPPALTGCLWAEGWRKKAARGVLNGKVVFFQSRSSSPNHYLLQAESDPKQLLADVKGLKKKEKKSECGCL